MTRVRMETPGRLVEAWSMPHFLTPVPLSTLSLSQDTQPPAPAAAIHTHTHTHSSFVSPFNAQLAGCGRAEPQMSYLWAVFPRCLHIIIKR